MFVKCIRNLKKQNACLTGIKEKNQAFFQYRHLTNFGKNTMPSHKNPNINLTEKEYFQWNKD